MGSNTQPEQTLVEWPAYYYHKTNWSSSGYSNSREIKDRTFLIKKAVDEEQTLENIESLTKL